VSPEKGTRAAKSFVCFGAIFYA